MFGKSLENSIYPSSVVEQRTVVSTVAYVVYDVMTGRVKEYKTGMQGDYDVSAELSSQVDTLVESNVSLYRYGGFAIHSVLQKYKDRKDTCSESITTILRSMIMKSEESASVPTAIHLLNQGG